MAGRRSLVDTVSGLLVRTYDMSPGIGDLAPFIVGDAGFRLHYASTQGHAVETARARRRRRWVGVAAEDGSGARTLLRESVDGVRVTVYFPDRMIRQLEQHPPQRGLHQHNVRAFAVLVEEIDHLLLIAERARRRRPVSLFELELHAEVSKYLVLARFLAGSGAPLTEHHRVWLKHHLFEAHSFSDPDPKVRERYRQARRAAVRFLRGMALESPQRRVRLLRRFHHADAQAKLRLSDRFAAA